MKKILTTTFFVLAATAILIMLYNYSVTNNVELFALSHSPISMQEGDRLFFFDKGFAIVNEHTNFFDNNGQEAPFPFTFDDGDNRDFTITDLTGNYMLINGNSLFKIDGLSLKAIYSLESTAIGLKEFGRFLLLIIESPGGNLKLKFLDPENGFLSDLGFDDNLYYLDADWDTSNTNLSILTLDIDASYPSSKILHYNEDLSLYGFASSLDHVYYRVFKFPSITILIGNRELVCYNIEGDLEWKIEDKGLNKLQALRNDLGLLVYLDQKIKAENSQEYFNAIFISNNGNRQEINVPPQLTTMSPFKDKFLALQYGKNILTLNKYGKVESEFFLDEDIKNIFVNPYQTNNFLILKANDILQVYSTRKGD